MVQALVAVGAPTVRCAFFSDPCYPITLHPMLDCLEGGGEDSVIERKCETYFIKHTQGDTTKFTPPALTGKAWVCE